MFVYLETESQCVTQTGLNMVGNPPVSASGVLGTYKYVPARPALYMLVKYSSAEHSPALHSFFIGGLSTMYC